MLPLDKLTDVLRDALASEGISPDRVDMVLRMDQDKNGDLGECHLVFSAADDRLYRVSNGLVDSFVLSELTEPYIDNYATANRLQAHRHAPDDLPPEQGDMSDDEFKALRRTYDCGGTTIVLGYCTNGCKLKLLAFLSLWERLGRGDTIPEDDPVFEQFRHSCPTCGRPYKNPRRKVCEHCTKKKGTMRRLMSYFMIFKTQLVIVVLCLLATTAISLITPIVSGQILFDQVISKPTFDEFGNQITGRMHELHYVYIWVGVLIGLALLSLGIGIIQHRTNAYLSTRVTRNMKNDIFTAMQKLSLSYFNANPTGRLMNRVNYDAERIRSFFIDGVPYFISHVLSYIVLTVILFCINWKLTLILYLPVIPVVLIFKFVLPKLWKCFSHQWRHSSAMNAMMNDSLTGIRVVKAFAKEDAETNRFFNYSTRLYKANLRTNLVSLTIFPVISLLIGITCHAMWGFAGFEVIGERMTYGELSTYMGYTGLIFGPLNFFTNFTNMVTDTMNSAERMFEVLDTVPEVVEAENPVKLDTLQGDIVFSHVNFHYAPNRPILKDISFIIHKGDHVGLVGHTGSGKSTIANLITRMYDVVSGSIEIDGVDIKQMDMNTLRRNVAIVSQEVYIFRGSIADNIRYGRPEATLDEVIAAAKAANAHDFIMRLPEGYETSVGIGSRSLSGGERQRVSIARALLMDPSLLILDEATAAMDTETERLISEAIERVSEGKTTISIAHRLSSLKDCNYLMAIDNGELAEIGTAEELIERKGIYYKLWTLQNEQLRKVMEGE
ncbi:MAG: ABC transporter ATP-binding protein [Clostridia bacterium]|nr:ABC transporter ATP-binding protein [Clostridia bacterium]